jgi:hypothetical protein
MRPAFTRFALAATAAQSRPMQCGRGDAHTHPRAVDVGSCGQWSTAAAPLRNALTIHHRFLHNRLLGLSRRQAGRKSTKKRLFAITTGNPPLYQVVSYHQSPTLPWHLPVFSPSCHTSRQCSQALRAHRTPVLLAVSPDGPLMGCSSFRRLSARRRPFS